MNEKEEKLKESIRIWKLINKDYLEWQYMSYEYKERNHQPFRKGNKPTLESIRKNKHE